MSRIIPEEEFAKRFKKPRFMSQLDNDKFYERLGQLKIEREEDFKFKNSPYQPKPIVLTREEFINRLRESIMNKEKEVNNDDQYFDKYATKVGNEYVTKTTFNDLLNKVDLVLKNQEVIIDLLSREDKSDPEQTLLPIKVLRGLYKQNVKTGQKVLVGLIDNNNVVTLKEPPLSSYRESVYYLPDWFIMTKAIGVVNMLDYVSFGDNKKDYPADVLSKSEYQVVVPRNRITELSGSTGDISGVTGYVSEQGKAIYYDQYRTS